mgnify:CR=1 FL=1|tara:strand:+ start:615 stop:806 length:192 start_codon:yes stop_codon:yes gene_type:complete
MLIAALTNMAAKKLSRLPLNIGLVFVGIAISWLGDVVPGFHTLAQFELTPEACPFCLYPDVDL